MTWHLFIVKVKPNEFSLPFNISQRAPNSFTFAIQFISTDMVLLCHFIKTYNSGRSGYRPIRTFRRETALHRGQSKVWIALKLKWVLRFLLWEEKANIKWSSCFLLAYMDILYQTLKTMFSKTPSSGIASRELKCNENVVKRRHDTQNFCVAFKQQCWLPYRIELSTLAVDCCNCLLLSVGRRAVCSPLLYISIAQFAQVSA